MTIILTVGKESLLINNASFNVSTLANVFKDAISVQKDYSGEWSLYPKHTPNIEIVVLPGNIITDITDDIPV